MPPQLSIEELFREWQRELRLCDWNIQYGVRSAMELGGDHARVSIFEKKKCAFVSLLDPLEAPVDEIEPYDIEVAIVHELLHVRLYAFREEPESFEGLCLEQAVHVNSTLLVKQQRRIRELEGNTPRRRRTTKHYAVASSATSLKVA